MYLSFILLTLAIILLWVPARQRAFITEYAWLGVFVLALAVALYHGLLDWVALLPLIVFGFVCFAYTQLRGGWRLLLGLCLIGLSLGFGLHIFPGFHNPLIVNHVQLSPDSLAYSLRFNLDKPVIGLFILAWLHPLLQRRPEVLSMLRLVLPVAIITVALVVMSAYLLGYMRFEMKLPDFLLYWLWANLFFTCVAEEALFRGFIQRQLAMTFSKFRYNGIVALVVSAVLFGLAHAAGGIIYVLLATLAGLGYGWAYQRTQRIEASILLHFILNCVHIIFFSYPALLG